VGTESDPLRRPQIPKASSSLLTVVLLALALIGGILAGCAPETQSLTVYSAREEELMGPVIALFEEATGIKVGVKYGQNAGLVATIQEEGKRSPADIFFSTDPGLLGVLSERFTQLPESILGQVRREVQSREGKWVGISGRARTVIYNTKKLSEADLPDSIFDFIDPKWKGRIGWAPANGSFQAMVTAMRVHWGEEKTRQWLAGIQANEPKVYPKNSLIVAAAAVGEIDVGFVNHYYLHRQLAVHGEAYPARNYHPRGHDLGATMLVAGAGILSTSKNKEAAERFLSFMLSQVGQQFFASQTFEYPLVEGVKTDPQLKPFDQLELPDVDLSRLADVKGTQNLLREVRVIP